MAKRKTAAAAPAAAAGAPPAIAVGPTDVVIEACKQ